jgi:hypothetical protein
MHRHENGERRHLFPQLRRHLLTRAALACGIFALAFALHAMGTDAADSWYRDALAREGIDAGASPGLAYARAVTERNPLLAIPGTDVEKLERALDELARTQDALAALQSERQRAAEIERHLYPVGFLRSLAAAERARRTFIASGSANDLRAYQRAQRETAIAYQEDLRGFRGAFKRNVPADIGSYVADGDRVSRDAILGNIDSLLKAIDDVEEELLDRSQCFQGNTASCDMDDIALPHVSSIPSGATTEASAVARRVKRLLDGIRGEVGPQPFVRLAHSYCAENVPGASFLIHHDALSPDGETYTEYVDVGDIRFTDSEAYADIGFYDFFAKNGVKYVLNMPINHYTCPQVGTDAGTLFAIKDILDYASKVRGDGLLEPEEAALTKPDAVVTEEMAAGYLEAAFERIQSGRMAATETPRLIELALALNNRSAGFDDVVFWISSIERENARLYRDGIDIGLGAPYLFYVRNALLPLYLAANPSFGGIEGRAHEYAAIAPEAQPYIYYSQLPRSAATDAKVARDFSFYINLHESTPTGQSER